MLKKIYISIIKVSGRVLAVLGLFKWLLKYPQNKKALYVRSVFAIYDFEKMAELDLPWWNFEAIEEIESYLKNKPNSKVFEYGSGASTIWLSRRAASIVSVEYDDWFYGKLKPYLSENVQLILRDPEDEPSLEYGSKKNGHIGKNFEAFVKEIESHEKFDLIIIDGRAREKCLDYAIKHLNEDGIILFDDTHRARYMDAIKKHKLIVKSYKGLTPSLIYPNKTSLLSK